MKYSLKKNYLIAFFIVVLFGGNSIPEQRLNDCLGSVCEATCPGQDLLTDIIGSTLTCGASPIIVTNQLNCDFFEDSFCLDN